MGRTRLNLGPRLTVYAEGTYQAIAILGISDGGKHSAQ